jgi:hypothetical protein
VCAARVTTSLQSRANSVATPCKRGRCKSVLTDSHCRCALSCNGVFSFAARVAPNSEADVVPMPAPRTRARAVDRPCLGLLHLCSFRTHLPRNWPPYDLLTRSRYAPGKPSRTNDTARNNPESNRHPSTSRANPGPSATRRFHSLAQPVRPSFADHPNDPQGRAGGQRRRAKRGERGGPDASPASEPQHRTAGAPSSTPSNRSGAAGRLQVASSPGSAEALLLLSERPGVRRSSVSGS